MPLEAHVKQQIRFEIENTVEQAWELQKQALQTTSGYLKNVVGRQYQKFNHWEAKRRHLRQKRKVVRSHWKEQLAATLEQVSALTPVPFEKDSKTMQQLLDLPFASVDRVEEVVEETAMQLMRKALHKNREIVDATIHKTTSTLESYHQNLNQQLKDHLAAKLPFTEEERFSAAKDITSVVTKKSLDT